MILDILLIIIIIIIIILFILEKSKSNALKNQISSLNENIEQKFTNQNVILNSQMQELLNSLDTKMNNQNSNVKLDMQAYFQKVDLDFQKQTQINNNNLKEIIQRVTKLDATKEQMQDLSQSINQLQSVFTDKKARGSLGEMQLNNIFADMFGEKSDLYEVQKKLENGKIVDLLLHAPDPLGAIGIDSKFPLESYIKISDTNLGAEELKEAQKQFVRDLKKHITDISEKYITEETANQAIMFIPSEAIFNEIIANYDEIINYSYASKVWITSPTTLMAILNVIQIAIKDLKRYENADRIHEEVVILAKEFARYETRWSNFTKHFQMLNKDVEDITVTTNKIIKKFDAIEKVEIDDE